MWSEGQLLPCTVASCGVGQCACAVGEGRVEGQASGPAVAALTRSLKSLQLACFAGCTAELSVPVVRTYLKA